MVARLEKSVFGDVDDATVVMLVVMVWRLSGQSCVVRMGDGNLEE